MISEKKGVEIPSRSDWTAGTGSSRLLSYNTQNASVDLFILKTRGAGVGSKTRTSDAIPFKTCVTPIRLLHTAGWVKLV